MLLDMLGVVGSNLKMVKSEPTTVDNNNNNNSVAKCIQHRSTNNVTSKCCDHFAGLYNLYRVNVQTRISLKKLSLVT